MVPYSYIYLFNCIILQYMPVPDYSSTFIDILHQLKFDPLNYSNNW